MLRYVFRALAACASIAAFTLFALPASAQLVIDAAEQSAGGDGIFEPFSIENGVSFTYRRDGSTVTARGVTDGHVGEGNIFDLNRFEQ